MAKTSVLIAARNEPHLPRMVAHLLARLTGDFEILVGLDGDPGPALPAHSNKVLRIFQWPPRGLKPTINDLAQLATGDYLLKLDAHCAVSEGIDEVLQRDMQPNWMVVPRFHTLDEAAWAPHPAKPHNDYWLVDCPLTDLRGYRFRAGGYWFERTRERADVGPLDESMTHHGSCWFTSRRFFLEGLRGMQISGYGANYMEPADLGFRTWMLGGKVIVRKDCWYAHLHQDHRARGYPVDWPEVKRSYRWTAEHWMRRADFAQLVERFMPIPTWPADWQARQREHERQHPWDPAWEGTCQ
jgi:glycosyltransferase involved in cell wall biosynthesis